LNGSNPSLSTKCLNTLGKNSGSPFNTARFFANSLKFGGKFKLNNGVRDMSCKVASNNHDASIWVPRISENNKLVPKARNKLAILPFACDCATALSSSVKTER